MLIPNCPTCGKKLHRAIATFDVGRIVGLPHVVVDNMRAFVCPEGHAPWFQGRHLDLLMKLLTTTMVVEVDILGGCEVQYLRKYLREPLTEFAQRLGVQRETLAAWEREATTELDAPTSYAIRSLVARLLNQREHLRLKIEPVASREGHRRRDTYRLDMKRAA